MAKLEKIWIEHDDDEKRTIRIDWDNDRHQRVPIKGATPQAVGHALKEAGGIVIAEHVHGKI